MNNAAKQWVAALRSGEYTQGTGALCNVITRDGEKDKKFCCLGVACDLYAKEHPDFEVHDNGTFVEYGDMESAYLPPQVQEWVGLKNPAGRFSLDAFDTSTLAGLNDDGRSFEEIAATIESEPEGLFA